MTDWKNTATHYGAGARVLHWTMSLLVLTQLATGYLVWEFLERGPTRSGVMLIHFGLGMTLLLLILLRLGWRLRNPPPAPIAGQPDWLVKGARAGHRLLYILLVVAPLSGWLTLSTGGTGPSFFGLFRFPPIWREDEALHDVFEVVHKGTVWILTAVVVGHVLAALYHQFGRKDGTLRRMLG